MIPAYNVEKFLADALESALGQTYSGSYEILVVNDGSTDKTKDITDAYQRMSNEIRVIHQENKGNAFARNVLLDHAKGNILLGLDADDVLDPAALEKVVSYFRTHHDVGMIYSDQHEISEDGTMLRTRKRSVCNLFSDKLAYHCHFQGHLRSYRRDMLSKVRFNETLRSAVDYDFFLNLRSQTKVDHIPEVLYKYRLNNNGISLGKKEPVVDTTLNLLRRHLIEKRIYADRTFEIVPVVVDHGIRYFDHFIDNKSVMDSKAREVLLDYLRS